jgi:hypothetical protein
MVGQASGADNPSARLDGLEEWRLSPGSAAPPLTGRYGRPILSIRVGAGPKVYIGPPGHRRHPTEIINGKNFGAD